LHTTNQPKSTKLAELRKLILVWNLIFTQLDEICKKKYRGAIKKNKKKYITSSHPRKLIFGIQPYLTQQDKICKNDTDWDAIKKKKWGAMKKIKIGCHKKKSKQK
jgi:hypothetical protein